MSRRLERIPAWLALGCVATAAPVWAQDECEALRSRVEQLEREVESLRGSLGRRAADRSSWASATAWKDPRSWRRLQPGMSRYEVMGILGEPGRIVRYDAFERWEYPDFLGGRVTIGEDGQLSHWRPPPGRAAGRRPRAESQ